MNIEIDLKFLERLLFLMIPIIGTYFVTRYTIMNPKKIVIKEKQLKEIYAPLYEFLCKENIQFSSFDGIKGFSSLLHNSISRNYLLAHRKLIILDEELLHSLERTNFDELNKLINKLRNYIKIEFELLKKSLGYPSDSFVSIFRRMTKKEKCEWLIGWLNVLTVFPGALVYLFAAQHYPPLNCIVFFILHYIFLFAFINPCIQKMRE